MDIQIGQMFGKWEVIGEPVREKEGHHWLYPCRCSCEAHTEKYIDKYNLIKGKSRSCGCIASEVTRQRMTRHGLCRTRLFHVWLSMRARCNNPKNTRYAAYGGRGIKICDEWNDFKVFHDWAYANGYDESAKYGECTIDRIDTNGNYEPSNCRWCNSKEQANNRRRNVNITYNGETKTAEEWAESIGIKSQTLRKRIYDGLDIEQVMLPKNIHVVVLTYNGESHTIKEWSEIIGVQAKTIYERYRKGLPIEKILYSGNLLNKERR